MPTSKPLKVCLLVVICVLLPCDSTSKNDENSTEAPATGSNEAISDLIKHPNNLNKEDMEELQQLQGFNQQFYNDITAQETAELADHGIDDDTPLKMSDSMSIADLNGNPSGTKRKLGHLTETKDKLKEKR